MKQYLELLDSLLTVGHIKSDRTGVGTITRFGWQFRHDMAHGFPLLTTKRLHIKSILWELTWFLSGETNIKLMKDNGVSIWNEWADKDGEVGPLYGYQWRHWKKFTHMGEHFMWEHNDIDQLSWLVNEIKVNPNSRRMLVSAWNVADISAMRLPPCHFAFQCQVLNNRLNMHVFMRSLDIFLGAPFDIASYGFLLLILAEQTGYKPGELLLTATDVHLYRNHIQQASEQIIRTPKALPQAWVSPGTTIDNFTPERMHIVNYCPDPNIPAPVAV